MPTTRAAPSIVTTAIVATLLGVLGGAALVAVELGSTIGPLVVVLYVVLVLAVQLVLRRMGEHRTRVLYAAGLFAFTVATMLLLAGITRLDPHAVDVGAAGFLARLGVMVVVGALVHLAAVRLRSA